MDARILNLSYSSLLTLHQCPRKFQLYRCSAQSELTIQETELESITLLYGTVVGNGVQFALQGLSEDEIIWRSFLSWNQDLFARDHKRNKDFWQAITAIQKFIYQVRNEALADYELVYFDGKPAIELSFLIELPGGFKYRGFVDAVLQHKYTGEILVLEHKTTGARAFNSAQYKNSAQAIGYSIVLDHIFPGLSSYSVLYAVYMTQLEEYVSVPFTKTLLQRALWLQELLFDTQIISMYENSGVYPHYGESCFIFGRECKYFHCCHMSTEHLVEPPTQKTLDDMQAEYETYQITVSFQDLISSQLAKQDA